MRLGGLECEDRGSGCDLWAHRVRCLLRAVPSLDQYPFALMSLVLGFLAVPAGLHRLGL